MSGKRKKHDPDHEMRVMQRGVRELTALSPGGRRRVLAYWCARVETMPASGDQHGEQQLDVEDIAPVMPPLRGAAALT